MASEEKKAKEAMLHTVTAATGTGRGSMMDGSQSMQQNSVIIWVQSDDLVEHNELCEK
jgi:hypothetical protein